MKMRKKRMAVYAIAVLVAASLSTTAQAVIVLDQINDAPVKSVVQARSIDYQGQTFTVGLAGTLANIKLDIGDDQVPPVDVDFHLARIVGGVAEFSHSYEIVVPSSVISDQGRGSGPATMADWLNLDFSSFDIDVRPGDQFALVAHSPITFEETGAFSNEEQINWFASNPGPYLFGTPIDPGADLVDTFVVTRNDFDENFATYVNVAAVPEPEVWAMLILGFAATGSMLRSARLRKAAPTT